jgi:Ca2+-binding RTX toxin-like protein
MQLRHVSLVGLCLVALVLALPAAAETISGTQGNDVLEGTTANDRIFGWEGNDKLFGLAGNDLLNGGPGRDRISGGPGADRIGVRDQARDVIDCGAGRDRVTADHLDEVRFCEVVLRSPRPSPPRPEPPPPPEPTPPPAPPVAPVTAGAYQGQTQNGNFVFFTVTPNRAITGFRINDLPAPCDGPLQLVGSREWGSASWPIQDDGRFTAEGHWTGSDVDGDAEWTRWDVVLTGYFNNSTSVTGTVIESSELNLQGRHWRCSSGEVRWSASLR